MKVISNQRGASLLEMLIATTIALIGIAGFVKLHTGFIRADAQLQYQHIANQLAEEKLLDLRQSSSIYDGRYQRVVSNQGGQLNAGAVQVLLDGRQHTKEFFRHWQVHNYYLWDSDGDNIKETWLVESDYRLPEMDHSLPHLKQVVIEISWVDNIGVEQQMLLNSVIAPVLASRRNHLISENVL